VNTRLRSVRGRDQPWEERLACGLRSEVKRLALPIPCKRYIQELINGELHVGAEIPTVSEIPYCAPIKTVVDSRDIDRNSCQRNLEIGGCDGLSSRFELTRDADNSFVKLGDASRGSRLQLNCVFSVCEQGGIKRAECQGPGTCRI
jgi:hypothetical protein